VSDRVREHAGPQAVATHVSQDERLQEDGETLFGVVATINSWAEPPNVTRPLVGGDPSIKAGLRAHTSAPVARLRAQTGALVVTRLRAHAGAPVEKVVLTTR